MNQSVFYKAQPNTIISKHLPCSSSKRKQTIECWRYDFDGDKQETKDLIMMKNNSSKRDTEVKNTIFVITTFCISHKYTRLFEYKSFYVTERVRCA